MEDDVVEGGDGLMGGNRGRGAAAVEGTEEDEVVAAVDEAVDELVGCVF